MKKVNNTVLFTMILFIICAGDLMLTFTSIIYGIFAGISIGLSSFGCIISFTEILICEVCYEELEERYKRVSI